MFKTIDQCRLELVEYSVLNVQPKEITMLQDDSGAGAQKYIPLSEANADYMPCSAARASFGNEDKTGNDSEADKKLMRYLADHEHMTPFEYQHATFLIECPLFIRSQIHRHRTFSFNEISRRYTSDDIEFWLPTKFRMQSTSNRQASSDDVVTELKPRADFDDPFGEKRKDPVAMWKANCQIALNEYNHLIESGVAREIARAALPQALLTRFYMGGILRNWAHFIELRDSPHAQHEVRVVAQKIAAELRKLWPESCKALDL